MTHLFQLLELTVNGPTTAFLKAKFTEWFSQKIEEGLYEGKDFEDIDILLTLSVLKLLHAGWMIKSRHYVRKQLKVVIQNFKL